MEFRQGICAVCLGINLIFGLGQESVLAIGPGFVPPVFSLGAGGEAESGGSPIAAAEEDKSALGSFGKIAGKSKRLNNRSSSGFGSGSNESRVPVGAQGNPEEEGGGLMPGTQVVEQPIVPMPATQGFISVMKSEEIAGIASAMVNSPLALLAMTGSLAEPALTEGQFSAMNLGQLTLANRYWANKNMADQFAQFREGGPAMNRAYLNCIYKKFQESGSSSEEQWLEAQAKCSGEMDTSGGSRRSPLPGLDNSGLPPIPLRPDLYDTVGPPAPGLDDSGDDLPPIPLRPDLYDTVGPPSSLANDFGGGSGNGSLIGTIYTIKDDPALKTDTIRGGLLSELLFGSPGTTGANDQLREAFVKYIGDLKINYGKDGSNKLKGGIDTSREPIKPEMTLDKELDRLTEENYDRLMSILLAKCQFYNSGGSDVESYRPFENPYFWDTNEVVKKNEEALSFDGYDLKAYTIDIIYTFFEAKNSKTESGTGSPAAGGASEEWCTKKFAISQPSVNYQELIKDSTKVRDEHRLVEAMARFIAFGKIFEAFMVAENIVMQRAQGAFPSDVRDAALALIHKAARTNNIFGVYTQNIDDLKFMQEKMQQIAATNSGRGGSGVGSIFRRDRSSGVQNDPRGGT